MASSRPRIGLSKEKKIQVLVARSCIVFFRYIRSIHDPISCWWKGTGTIFAQQHSLLGVETAVEQWAKFITNVQKNE